MEQEFYIRRNSDELEDIISRKPTWIIRFGLTLMLLLLLGIITFSAYVKYPDVIKTSLTIVSVNSPKPAIARNEGKLQKLLVQENQIVEKGQALAYIESTGSHDDIMQLEKTLTKLQDDLLQNRSSVLVLPKNSRLGELQATYLIFYQDYLRYLETQNSGYLLRKKNILLKDIQLRAKIEALTLREKTIRAAEASNNEGVYNANKSLYDNKVIAKNDFISEENKYLLSKLSLMNSEKAILDNSSVQNSRIKELSELDNMIFEEKLKFLQSLNQCVSAIEAWEFKYIIKAPLKGQVAFVSVVEENQNIRLNQDLFVINPKNESFFGIAAIPQYRMGEVKLNQEVLIKLYSYPYEKFGIIHGRISKLSDVAIKDSAFTAKIDFTLDKPKDINDAIILKDGMKASIDVITENYSLFQRMTNSTFKTLNNR